MKQSVLFLIDGLRPDALQVAHTPTMDRLMAVGASTLSARTVMPSVTLPCIASLILSAPPEDHGIASNVWTSPHPGSGIFEIVAQAGGRTASFYNWEQLRDLSRPGALHAAIYIDNSHAAHGAGDLELAMLAADYLQAHPVDFAFVYLGHTDAAGHDHGWMSGPYLEAVETADRCLATVLSSLGESPDRLVAVTSDHGGHETHHGTAMAEDMTTPVIISRHWTGNASVPAESALRDVSILDIVPTIAAWMDLAPARSWRGRALPEVGRLLS